MATTFLRLGCAALLGSSFLAPPARAQHPTEVVHGFAPFDVDGDGIHEVERLTLLRAHDEGTAPYVAVLVESRLLPGSDVDRQLSPLTASLATFAADLAAAGFRVLVIECELHTGPPHQDGRTVLALRRLFQRLHAQAPMAGAVLVGHFPDALLVRTCSWRRNEVLTLPDKDGKPVAIDAKTTNVRCVPEIVAHRCDVVLADLDGDWESVYVPGPEKIPAVTAVFGDTVPDAGGHALALQTGELPVIDVFHVRDGAAALDVEAFAVALDAADRDHECTAADRTLGNPLAQPELGVSRIDARGVALLPDVHAGAASPYEGALDTAGRPASFRVAADTDKSVVWRHDFAFEIQLLCDYFARNHAFRTKPLAKDHDRPAAFGHELGAGLHGMIAANAAWQGFAEAGYDVHEHSDLVALAHWLQRPAVLRTLRVHSDPWGGAVAKTDPARLTEVLGVPWHWLRDGDRLVPSWHAHRGGRADFVFYRTLWQRQLVGDNPYLLIHTGCEAVSQPGSVEHPYDHPAYGQRAHAESMLFFTPCLAIVGRAKVFYDEPRGFCEALGEGKTFGEAWQRYFAIEGAAANWDEAGGDIGRKRAYFWSVVGDWTLRLPR